ncbi:MAG: hypothetical protein J7623_31275 [Chitinophaga sp.]|uniref:hypothetical protein n=1 Tax=Chitinophaga sp. TaxID=1869181 RepID=UPI001B1CFA38|nr:hypothetical protein [Chitinophaga sp.]MBO9733165.1 hypothetical protein [Chitinophaga sp.]
MTHEELYGINKEHAHPRAIELLPEDFFWDCVDELAPFGSDEGDMALAEFREWRKANPHTPVRECLKWVIESIGEMSIEAYNEELLDRDHMKALMDDPGYDDSYYIFTLDASIIATGFGQLVDEGVIDEENKGIISIALERQIAWALLSESWSYAEQHIGYLNIMKRALEEA